MVCIDGEMGGPDGVSGEFHHPGVDLQVEVELWTAVLHVLLHVVEAELVARLVLAVRLGVLLHCVVGEVDHPVF